MRFKTLALIGTLALAGCGSQTYTVQPVKQTAQHVTTAAKPVKPKLQIRCTNAALAAGNCGTPQQQAAARMALSAPSWLLYVKRHGCPTSEIPASNGGCVDSGSHECSISEPTCNPANYPDPAQSTTAPPSQPQSALQAANKTQLACVPGGACCPARGPCAPDFHSDNGPGGQFTCDGGSGIVYSAYSTGDSWCGRPSDSDPANAICWMQSPYQAMPEYPADLPHC